MIGQELDQYVAPSVVSFPDIANIPCCVAAACVGGAVAGAAARAMRSASLGGKNPHKRGMPIDRRSKRITC